MCHSYCNGNSGMQIVKLDLGEVHAAADKRLAYFWGAVLN